MADNFLRFNRFTALPANISEHGATLQEIGLQKGKPDPDPFLSPMAQPGRSDPRLGLRSHGSDRARLGAPAEPTVNPFEGPRLALSYARDTAAKLQAAIMGSLQQHIESGGVEDAQLSGMMLDSLRRVTRLRQHLEQVNAATETIYSRIIANASA